MSRMPTLTGPSLCGGTKPFFKFVWTGVHGLNFPSLAPKQHRNSLAADLTATIVKFN